MPASALRPRSVTEIVDASFQIFRAHAGQMVMCSAIAYVPVVLLQLLVVGDPRRFGTADPAQAGAVLRVMMQSALVGVLSYTLMSAVLTICASQAYLGEPVDVGGAVRRVLSRLVTVLAASLIVSALIFLGFMVLFVPAVWVAARYFAVTQAVLLEGLGVTRAMSRSSELSRGRKWHVLNTLGLVLLIYFMIFFGVSIVMQVLGNFVLRTLIGALITICVYPVVAIAGVLLYYDARIQSEGLDIELMADALGPVSSPALG
jgi:hypothetical protein